MEELARVAAAGKSGRARMLPTRTVLNNNKKPQSALAVKCNDDVYTATQTRTRNALFNNGENMALFTRVYGARHAMAYVRQRATESARMR